MTTPDISGIAPFFIVKSVPAALSFYRDRLGFDITFQGPSEDDVFFGIVQRGAAMIMLKAVGVDPVPNYIPPHEVIDGEPKKSAQMFVPTRWKTIYFDPWAVFTFSGRKQLSLSSTWIGLMR